MSINKHPEWLESLRQDDIYRQISLGHQLVKKLDVDDIDDLIVLFAESPEDRQRYIAGGLLIYLYEQKDLRLNDVRRRKIEDAAEEIVRKDYPRTPLGQRAHVVLRSSNRSRAEQSLLSGIDPAQLTPSELRLYLSNLEFLRTAGTINKLKDLEAMGGEIGRLAYQSLGNIGQLSRPQLEALVDQFKREGSSALLYKIYYVFLSFQRGQPIQAVRDLLGEPAATGNFEGGDCLMYRGKNPPGEVKVAFQDGVIIAVVADD